MALVTELCARHGGCPSFRARLTHGPWAHTSPARQHRRTRRQVPSCRRERVRARGAAPIADLAMLNTDHTSPALWLGVVVAMCGLALTSYRASGARGLSDTELVTSSLLVLCGGILAVVGWRLDPILMLSEGILASVGLYYIVQTVKLRAQVQVRRSAHARQASP